MQQVLSDAKIDIAVVFAAGDEEKRGIEDIEEELEEFDEEIEDSEEEIPSRFSRKAMPT